MYITHIYKLQFYQYLKNKKKKNRFLIGILHVFKKLSFINKNNQKKILKQKDE